MIGIREPQRTVVVRCVLAVGLALVAALTGVGQQATAAGTGPRDVTQDYFYVPVHSQEPYTSDVLRLEFTYDGPPRDAELAVDASGIDGVAVIEAGADGCKPRMPSFTCSRPLNPDGNSQELQIRPAADARAGDSGILRYTLKPEGLPAVRGSLTVIAGQPELRVNKTLRLRKMAAGETFSVPIVIRNTGDVAARGVGLVIRGEYDLSAATRHSNCRYSKDASTTRCLLPDAFIAPGQTMRVTPTLRVKANRDALDERLLYGAWAYGTREIPCCVGSAGTYLTTPGHGTPLSLTRDPARGEGATFTTTPQPTEEEVRVRNTADVEVFGASLRGDVGSSHHIRIGYRNNGPAQLEGISTVFIVPPGTKVTQAPYHPDDPEAENNECTPEENGRRYICSQHSNVGQKVFYEFTLRITSEDTRSGCIAVSDSDVKDTERDNDTAAVQVAENGSFSCALPKDAPPKKDGGGVSDWAFGAGFVAVAVSVLLVVRYRRRKAPRSQAFAASVMGR
jgi:hypothetical protein